MLPPPSFSLTLTCPKIFTIQQTRLCWTGLVGIDTCHDTSFHNQTPPLEQQQLDVTVLHPHKYDFKYVSVILQQETLTLTRVDFPVWPEVENPRAEFMLM